MDLFVGTVTLRPYVFAFLGVFVVAAVADLGWRRTLGFWACVWPVALMAELSSTRTGFPFGLYHYTGLTRGRELFIADVPFIDSLSFVFLAYAAFCLARMTLAGRAVPRWVMALAAGVLMMALDVVIDPLAVLGDRWFLGPLFAYDKPGPYFGVPLSNFAGWVIVGAAGVGAYLALARDQSGRRVWPGVALYYAVLGFNLTMTVAIGELLLAVIGATIHLVLVWSLWSIHGQPGAAARPQNQGTQRL
ncbi:MAG: carotenoid biosynthesis protein [Candidatus Rokuibacteriota bacterium]